MSSFYFLSYIKNCLPNMFLPSQIYDGVLVLESTENEDKEKKVKSLSRVRLFATPWTVAYQALRSLSVHGIFQARVLEWVAISFSRGSSQPRD